MPRFARSVNPNRWRDKPHQGGRNTCDSVMLAEAVRPEVVGVRRLARPGFASPTQTLLLLCACLARTRQGSAAGRVPYRPGCIHSWPHRRRRRASKEAFCTYRVSANPFIFSAPASTAHEFSTPASTCDCILRPNIGMRIHLSFTPTCIATIRRQGRRRRSVTSANPFIFSAPASTCPCILHVCIHLRLHVSRQHPPP